ncbi:LAFE_0G17282g1_1 [Lachancea fermentati]|uniref:LAFE_0G17282g1_1 n=1 Tax=Lachancea fermentati TaxID=4955 RepID=A0A1G4MIQ8_LACFM|nr:LAFE_0G17282g1_1 [Lachancea fermentati]
MEDPFLAYTPFKNCENLYIRHLHEIVGSFVFYQFIIFRWLAPKANKLIFGRHYSSIKDEETKLNFDIHAVSMVQSVVSLVLTWKILFLPFSLNVATYQDPFTSMVSSLTIGYFLWDLYVCLKYFSMFGIGFLGHACGSLYVFTISLRPFCQPWIGKFLIFEASTPFVNINWYISQLSRTSSKPVVPTWFNMANGLLLMLVFFLVRIVWGFAAIVILCYQLWVWRAIIPNWLPFTLVPLNFGMDALNVFWLSKMVKIAKKMANGGSKSKKF